MPSFPDSIVFSPQPLPAISTLLLPGGLQLSFETVSRESYIVEWNSSLGTTNWTAYTNVIGDGAMAQFTIPRNKALQFFRFRMQ